MRKYKDYILITIGTALVAMAIQLFFVPNKIAPGGVSGIGLALTSLTPNVSVSTYVIIINIFLTFKGIKKHNFHIITYI